MTDLDTLARSATRELLDRSAPDVSARYGELRRIRARRTGAKLVAVAAAVAVAAGGWRLVGGEENVVEPAPAPAKVTNGTLLALPESGPRIWVAVEGEPPPAGLSQEVLPRSTVQFTSDGTELVYGDRTRTLVALDILTGEHRVLGRCPNRYCMFSLSPDGTTLASLGDGGIQLTPIGGAGEPQLVETPPHGLPAWAPEGTRLAFAAADGVHVLDLATGQESRVHAATEPAQLFLSVSWAPDGSALAFFDTETVRYKGYDGTKFTAMTVSLGDGTEHVLLDAGRCVCLSGAPPTLTWSPDGSVVAVSSIQGGEHPGINFVTPAGEWTGSDGFTPYYALAWQPVIE